MYIVFYRQDCEPYIERFFDKNSLNDWLKNDEFEDIPWNFKDIEEFDGIDIMEMKPGDIYIFNGLSVIPEIVQRVIEYKIV